MHASLNADDLFVFQIDLKCFLWTFLKYTTKVIGFGV